MLDNQLHNKFKVLTHIKLYALSPGNIHDKILCNKQLYFATSALRDHYEKGTT